MHDVDHNGMTFLHWAAYRGSSMMVQELLNIGMHPHVLNFHALTPTYLAKSQGHEKALEVLSQHLCVQVSLVNAKIFCPDFLRTGNPLQHEFVMF